MNTAVLNLPPEHEPGAPSAPAIAVWVVIGVASALFALFLAAYVMRMDGGDWTPIATPWQLWLSTALLVVGSAALQRAAQSPTPQAAHGWLVAGGAFAIAFLLSQLWAWQALHSARVAMAGNPAASFFYLLTAMHGLHVLGGIAGWGAALHRPSALRIRLCARYWHFLLAVWVVLFAALGWLTPEIVAFICGTDA